MRERKRKREMGKIESVNTHIIERDNANRVRECEEKERKRERGLEEREKVSFYIISKTKVNKV
jgi:hypothetical protein